MKSIFEDPGFLTGVITPDTKPAVDDQTRSGGQTALDTAIDIGARPVLGMARSVTGLARDLSDTPGGYAEQVDQALGHADKWLGEQRSARAQRLDTLDPTQAEYWNANNLYGLTPTLHHALPLAGYAVPIGAAAKLGTRALGLAPEIASKVAAGVGMGAFGGLGLKQADNKLRDYADTTPIEDLLKSDKFQDIWRKNQGDVPASRNELYKEMLDPVARASNFGANVLTFGALKGASSPFAGLIQRILWGAGEGAVIGPAGGAAGAYTQQLGMVKAGTQAEIDPQKITDEMKQGLAMVGPVAGMHAMRGGHETAIDTGAPPAAKPAPTPAGFDPGVLATLDSQLNAAGHVPPTPAGGSAAGPAGAPAAGAPGTPPPAGGPPGGPPGAGGGPPTALAVAPPGPGTSGRPPVQQPTITVNPPGARQRTPPVTPAPTPVDQTVGGATVTLNPVGNADPAAVPPAGAAPPVAGAAPGMVNAMWKGQPVKILPKAPREMDGVTYATILTKDGIGYAPVGELSEPTSGVTPPPTAAAAPTEPVAPVAPTAPAAAPTAAAPGGEPPRPKGVMDASKYVGTNDAGLHVWRRPNGSLHVLQADGTLAVEPAPAVEPGSKGKPVVDKVKAKAAVEEPPKLRAGPATWANKDHDLPVNILDKPPVKGPDGRWYQPIESEGKEGHLPADELRPKEGPKPTGRTVEDLAAEARAKAEAEEEAAAAPGRAAAAADKADTDRMIAAGDFEGVAKKMEAKKAALEVTSRPLAIKEVPAGRATVEAVKNTEMLREDLATAPEGELKTMLRKTLNVHSDFDDLQTAADWGRANNRPDIVSAAADRADALVAKQQKKKPQSTFKGKQLEQAKATLATQLAIARERAAKVRGNEPEVVRKPKTAEPELPPEPLSEAPPSARTGATPEVSALAAKPEVKKPPRIDESLSAASLKRDDIVTLQNGRRYTVMRRIDRPDYPTDPYIQIKHEGVTDIEEHRASELDAERPAKSIQRAPEEKETKKGKPREKPAEMQLAPGKPVARNGRTPPVEYKDYSNYLGKNKDGHEVWEDPETNLRVTRHVESREVVRDGKTHKVKFSVTNLERPLVDRSAGETGRYERGQNFLVGADDKAVPPRIHRVHLYGEEIPGSRPPRYHPKPETHQRVEGPRAEGVREQTRREANVDLETHALAQDIGATTAAERRKEARRVATTMGKGEVPRVGRRLTGAERALNGDINKFHRGEPTQEEWLALRRRADVLDDARARVGLDPVFIDKLGRAPELGGGPTRPAVGPAPALPLGVQPETIRKAGLVEDQAKVLAERLRQFKIDESGMSIEQFDKRVAELKDYAQTLDLLLINQGEPVRFEAMVPKAKGNVDVRSDVQLADEALANVENLKTLPPGAFLTNPAVKAYFEAVKRVNDEIIQYRHLSKALGEPLESFPFRLHPSWIIDKVEAYRSFMPEPSALEVAGNEALKAAKIFYDEHVKISSSQGNVDTVLDRHARSAAKDKLVTTRLRELLRIKTDMEQAPAALTAELKNRIADAILSGRTGGSVNAHIQRAAELLAKGEKEDTIAQQKIESKDRQYAKRDEILDRSIMLTVTDFFRDKNGSFDIQLLDKFIDDLIGLKESHEVTRERVNKETGEVEEYVQVISRSLRKPEPPKVLGTDAPKHGNKRWAGKGPGTENVRYGAGESTGERRYRKELEAYEASYKKWEEDVLNQYAATQRLGELINAIIHRSKFELEEFKKNNKRATGSITWELPEGEPSKTSGYKDFTGGKNAERFEYYNFVIDMLKLQNHLEVDLQHLTDNVSFKGDMAGWDISKAPFEQYTRKLSPLLQQFGLDIRNVISGEMDRVNRARADRVAAVTHDVGVKKATAKDEEGVVASLSPDAVRDATSVTSEVDHLSEEDRMNAAIDAKMQEERDRKAAAALKESKTAPATPEELAKANVEPKREGRDEARTFGQDGLPNEGKRYVKGEPYVRDEVDAAHDQLLSDDPSHPKIDAPITTEATLDIVKQLIHDGDDLGDMSKAITPKFLDQLARITAGTQVYHAPYDVISSAGRLGPAFYDRGHDRIALPNDSADKFYAPTAVHEIVHAFFKGLVQRDHIFRGDMERLLERARDYAKTAGMVPKDYDFQLRMDEVNGLHSEHPEVYGLMSVDEMISEAKSSEKFRQFLTRIPTREPTIADRAKNVMQAVYAAIQRVAHKVMGKANGDTALDVLFYDQSNVLGSLDHSVAKAMSTGERLGRVRYRSDGDPSLDFARPRDPRDYVHPAAGTEFVEQPSIGANLRGYGTTTFDKTVDMGRRLAHTNRGAGLSVHTAFDMEHRTSDYGFQTLVHNVNKEIASQHTTARKMIDFEDGPVIERVGKFIRKLSPEWQKTVRHAFNEFNYHRAYPDAPIGERAPVDPKAKPGTKGKLIGKNAHIDPDDLANAQIVQEHDYVMGLWKNIEKIPGMRALANDTWGFYRKGQGQMKSRFIRTMAELDGIMPKGLSGDAHRLMLNALEKHITTADATKSGLTSLEQKALDRIDLEDPKLVEKVRDIRQVAREYASIEGPYLPMVRQGDFAVYGQFHMPTAGTGTVPATDRRTGQPKDNGIRVFDDRGKAEAYVRKITKEFGITQTDGGEWYYDPGTGKRAMRYTPEELTALNEKLKAKGEDPVKNRLIRKGEAKDMMDAGRKLDVKHFVEFSPQVLEKYDSLYDARKSVDRWRAVMGPDKLSITPPEPSHAPVGNHSEQHVSDTLQKVMNRFKAGDIYGGLDKHEQAGISQELRYLSQIAVMRRGVRQRFLPRGYVLGASHDMVRALADYGSAKAMWLAKMEHMPRITKAWNELNAYVDDPRRYDHGDKDTFARQAIRDAMGQRIHKQAEPLVDNMLSRGVDRLVRWTMLDKLPGLSYFTSNATEAGLLGIPLQFGRHGLTDIIAAHRYAHSIVGPMRMLGQGLSDVGRALAGKTVNRDWEKEFKARVLKDKYGPGVLDALAFMGKHGLLDQHASLEYQQMARHADSGVFKAVDVTADYFTNVFQAANSSIENLTRSVMGISSYKLERDRLGDTPGAHEKALRYMWDIVNRTSGVYANYNAPSLFQKGPIARLIFEFKKYPQRIIANDINAFMGTLGLFDKNVRADPVRFAEAKEKAKTLAALMVMQGMAAGALGMPTEIFSIPVNALYVAGLTTSNWEDYKAEFRRWAGDTVSYGLLNQTGINFQSKLDQSNMMFFGSPQSTKAQDLRGPILGILGGAGGGVLADVLTSGQKLAQAHHAEQSGNYSLAQQLRWEAARLGVPLKLVSDFIASDQQSTEAGRETPAGRRRGAPLSLGERLLKMGGFDTTRVANEQEKSRVLHRMEEKYKAEKARFMLEFSTGDAGAQGRVWQRVQKFNEGLPDDLHIKYSELRAGARTREKAQQTPLEHAGVALDRRGKAFLGVLHGVYD